MVRQYKPKGISKKWTQSTMQQALAEREHLKTSFDKLHQKYGIPAGTLHAHWKLKENNEQPKKRGRRHIFSVEQKQELTNCINIMAKHGFAPRIKDIAGIVHNYVLKNKDDQECKRALHTFKDNGIAGRPGYDWIMDFLKESNLSIKDATKLSVCRYNATRNPFIIYHWYDLVIETIQEMKLENRPDLIWNCDESGLPGDPKKN